MNKPLLLLVDDDPAVTSALEAELTPSFGGLVRIESFEDPRAVLRALPRWTAEHRSIALAIVDQRMPHLTGVELIAAIRKSVRAADASAATPTAGAPAADLAFHPARHLGVILLTGYAGLESAIAARNEADVDRYLEKPWDHRQLGIMARKLIAHFVADVGLDRYLEFREIESPAEVRSYLAMRYESYAASPSLRHLLPTSSRKRLDLDAYDTESRFFAVFSIDAQGSVQVGGLRLIGVRSAGLQRTLVAIASDDDELRRRASQPTRFAIELPEKWPDPAVIVRILDRIRASGEAVVEAGRLVIAPLHRSRSMGPGQVVSALYQGATTYVLEVIGIENVLQECTQGYRAAAARLGFRMAEGTEPTWNRRLRDTVVVLHGRESNLSDEQREGARCMGRGARSRGAACRCGTLPRCIGEPYASGAFQGTDLFCPRLAHEQLFSLADESIQRTVPGP